MNNQQKREMIKRWASVVQEYKAAAKKLETATGVSQFDSLQGAAADAVCCQYTQDLQVLLGDTDEWLSWFAFETNFGADGRARIDEDSDWVQVKTVDDLFKVMGIDGD